MKENDGDDTFFCELTNNAHTQFATQLSIVIARMVFLISLDYFGTEAVNGSKLIP